jgi:DNA-binding NtrC family response regulator
MKEKILIVEDKFVEADYLRLMLTNAGYGITGIAQSVPKAQQLINQDRPDFVLLDIFLKGNLTGIDLARELGRENIPFIYLSANSNEEVLNKAKATQPYGFLVKPFRERDIVATLEIARYRHQHNVESNLRKENSLKEKLSMIVAKGATVEEMLLAVFKALQPHFPFDYATAGFNAVETPSSNATSFLRIGFDEYQTIGFKELQIISSLSNSELKKLVNETLHNGEPALITGDEFEQICKTPSLHKCFSNCFQVKSCIFLPLHFPNGRAFVLSFYSRQPDTYAADHIAAMNRLCQLLAASIERILDIGKNGKAHSIKKKDTSALESDTYAFTKECFAGIVGKSPRLMNVFQLVTQVAPVETSVLILGESGTGKERIADCIHHMSPRKTGLLIKVNCAALPPTLIDSELFGHEKGSFTGAIEKRIGKFEQADKGTIFLDEIGDMPLDLQVKLLRVLQEKYVERIGARGVTAVDVRVIAATNRNLEKEVAEGRFRLDLYYRLNVFPIEMPPLRERLEDIPVLAQHFVSIYSRKAKKQITGVSEKVLKAMAAYHWPGNIRQFENLIERTVLLTKGSIIEEISLPIFQRNEAPRTTPDIQTKTIDEIERDHIISVLEKCKGKIWGSGGAAELLKVPPTTLKSKMKKLGIRKGSQEWI